MNMALNNAKNIQKYYDGVGEEVEIRIVAYGPGLHMLRADTSPVAHRIETMSLELPNLTFAACGNTHAAMSAKADKEVELLEEAELVPWSNWLNCKKTAGPISGPDRYDPIR